VVGLLSGCGDQPSKADPMVRSNAVSYGPSPTPSAIPRGPRTMLQSFLRAIAADDTTACRDVSPAYEHSTTDGFGGEGGCAKAFANDFRLMHTRQVRELGAVEVLDGVAGPRTGQFTVTQSDLRWPEGRLTMGILAVQYVLARVNGRWRIVG
jgi:hypothetical protein